MKHILFIFLSLIWIALKAQHKMPELKTQSDSTVFISGFLEQQATNHDSITLVVWKHFYSNLKKWNIPLEEMVFHFMNNPQGHFSFKITGISGPVYFSIGKEKDKANRLLPTLKLYIAEPGDSIEMLNFGQKNISFYGRGAAKYQCRYDLDNTTLFLKYDPYLCPDSTGQMQVLERYRGKMSIQSYNMMKADIIGQYGLFDYETSLMRLFGLTESGKRYNETTRLYDTAVWQDDRAKNYERWSKRYVSALNTKVRNGSVSRFYIQFLLETMLVCNKVLLGNKQSISTLIRSNYSGFLRDKLLTEYFEENFDLIDNADSLIQNILPMVETADCKRELSRLLRLQGEGQPAYMFSLPDKGGNIVNLTDFLGKIVFMDFWFTGCTACSEYYRNIISKAEENFKKDSTVVFITINTDFDREKWIGGLNSGLYTSNNAINLNTGSAGQESPIIKHYNIQGYPRALLIDKQGKIKSNSDNELRLGGVQKLIETINESTAKERK